MFVPCPLMGPIVGRAAELTSLRAAVSQGAAGRTRVVLVEGEAGIGKTTLLDAVADLARGEGIRIVRGAGLELEADRPFGPLIAALDLDSRSRDPGRRAIAKLVSGVTLTADGLAGSIPEHRYRAVDAICALIDHECTAGPLALLVDDLHWADESTLLTMRRLARSPGIPLLLVATARPAAEESPVGQVVETLASTGALRVRLRPLPKAEVRALVADLVGGPPGPRLLSLADGAGGNPLFLAELVAVLRQDGSLRAGELGVEVADGAGTADLARRLRARAARLGSEAAALVRVGAVMGTAFTLEEAARTGGWSAGDLLQPLDELLRAGLLVDDDGVLCFRHDLLRQAIEDELPPTARRRAARGRRARPRRHGRVRPPASPATWRSAPNTATRSPSRGFTAGARGCAARPATALTLLDTALALVAHDDPGRVELLADRVEALGWSGRNAEAEALARELIDQLEDRDTRLALRRQLGLALFIGNRPADAVEQLRISAEEVSDDPPARSLALAEGALGCIASGQLDLARSFVDEAVGLARRHHAVLALAVALSVDSRLLAFGGHAREALAAAEEAHKLAAGDDEIVRRQPGFFVVMCLLDLGRYDEVEALLREERRLAEERGVVWALPLQHAAAADRHLMLGELADAVTEATTGLTVAEDSGALLPAVWLHAVMATVALHRGDLRAADVHVGLGDQAMATTTPLLGADQHALVQARLFEARRDLAQAGALLRGAWTSSTPSASLPPNATSASMRCDSPTSPATPTASRTSPEGSCGSLSSRPFRPTW